MSSGSPLTTTSAALEHCSLLLGPVEILLGVLSGAAMADTWALAIYGLLEDLGVEASASSASAVSRSLTQSLRWRGWEAGGSCVLEDGWRRAWHWSPEERQGRMQREARAASHFGCRFRVNRRPG